MVEGVAGGVLAAQKVGGKWLRKARRSMAQAGVLGAPAKVHGVATATERLRARRLAKERYLVTDRATEPEALSRNGTKKAASGREKHAGQGEGQRQRHRFDSKVGF